MTASMETTFSEHSSASNASSSSSEQPIYFRYGQSRGGVQTQLCVGEKGT